MALQQIVEDKFHKLTMNHSMKTKSFSSCWVVGVCEVGVCLVCVCGCVCVCG